MLLKRILIGALCAVVVAGGIFYGVDFRFFDKPLDPKTQEAFDAQISLPDNFVLVAGSDCYNDVKNTMQAVRNSVSKGAYAIELDVSFAEDGTPYLADGSEYITDTSVPLEKVFQKYANENNLRYVLRIRNAGSPEKTAALATQYGVFDRILMTGFSLERMQAQIEELGTFPIVVDLDPTRINLNDAEQCSELVAECINSGAAMLLAHVDDITDTLLRALRKTHQLPLAICDVESKYDMFYALSLNPRMIITSRPDALYSIMFHGDHMGFKYSDTF